MRKRIGYEKINFTDQIVNFKSKIIHGDILFVYCNQFYISDNILSTIVDNYAVLSESHTPDIEILIFVKTKIFGKWLENL